MKTVISYWRGKEQTLNNPGIVFIGDDNGEGTGENDDVQWLGRIFGPDMHNKEGRFVFRPDDGGPDLNADQMQGVANELKRLDQWRCAHFVAMEQAPGGHSPES